MLGPLSLPQLCTAVMNLDDQILEPELLESIIANLPGEADAKKLRALKLPPAELMPSELFCFEMARLPRLRPMLHALRLRMSLPAALSRATSALSAIAQAARELMGSQSFARILASILCHGNFLNAGTARAGARGFRLDGLDKARALKSTDGRVSLLEHSCKAAQLSRAEIAAELGGVRPACRLPVLDVLRIIKEVEDGIEVVNQELALCPLSDLETDVEADVAADAALVQPSLGSLAGGADDQERVGLRFRATMAPFHTEMRRGLDALTARRDETRALLQKLAVWLGENPNEASPDALLKTCSELVETASAAAPPPTEEAEG